jgi:hypothetical protein
MSHVRTQIRQAAVAALDGIAAVSASRVYPIAEADLPVLLVWTNDEEITGGTHGAYARELTLAVEAVARGGFVDDDLDALLVSVENALTRSTLGGLCKPLSMTRIEISIEAGSTPIGRARATFRALYYTQFGNPESAL